MHLEALRFLALAALVVPLTACGGSVQPGTRDANEVTAAGMKQTFAGQNRCNPATATRPFVIEWDATDASSFQSRASSDVVFVRYVGCDLQIVDGCTDGSEQGRFGSYKPVEWTSGALESLDIDDSGDLYTKLPLGASSLAGRVEGGEKFHMEYFISGTRNATRGTIRRGDLAKVPACADATHFVSGYNLGAFALGARAKIDVTAGGSAFGFGASGDRTSSSKADKQGGVLASCKSDSAKELDTCKVPIRLTLRAIEDGESEDVRDARADETPEAHNLAARLQAQSDREHRAGASYASATDKMRAGDGAGCLADLDAHDRLDPRPDHLSTGAAMGTTRAQCLMLAGKCPAGKQLLRRAVEKAQPDLGPEQLDAFVEGQAADHCRGAAASPRDELLRAVHELDRAMYSRDEASRRRQGLETVKRLLPTVKPTSERDHELVGLARSVRGATLRCLAQAGDCASANQIWKSEPDPDPPVSYVRSFEEQRFAVATSRHCRLQ